MIPQVWTAAVVMLIGRAASWPITPMDNYTKIEIEELVVGCGYDEETVSIPFDTEVKFIFQDKLTSGCTAILRIGIKSNGLNKYGMNVKGKVHIEDPSGEDESCSSSYMTIADEDALEDETGVIERYCGTENLDFSTAQDFVMIKLSIGNSDVVGFGFDLTIDSHYLCGGKIEIDNQRITTPYYPVPYPRDIMCLWDIRPPEGQSMELSCERFDLLRRKRRRCRDMLLLMGEEQQKIFCGKELDRTKTEIKPSHKIILQFRSGERENSHLGFDCRVKFRKQKKNALLAKFYE